MPLEQMNVYKQEIKYIYIKAHIHPPLHTSLVVKNGSTSSLASCLLFAVSSKPIQKM